MHPDPRVQLPAPGQPGPPQQRWPGNGPVPAPYGYPGHPPYRLPPPPPRSPAVQPLATFGDRLLAYLLDAVILVAASAVLMVPLFVVFVFLLIPTLEPRPDGTPVEPGFAAFFLPLLLAELVFMLLMLGVYYLYSVEYQGRSGQTVGKRVVKIRVVPLDPSTRLDRGMLAKRFLVQYVAGAFVPLFSYLDGFWQLWDKPYQQCLHDRFAKTVVVKVMA